MGVWAHLRGCVPVWENVHVCRCTVLRVCTRVRMSAPLWPRNLRLIWLY